MTARVRERVALTILGLAAGATVLVLLVIILGVLARGMGEINPTFLTQLPRSMGREGGILPAIVSTVLLTLVALAIASPIGIGAAIYMAEYLRSRRAATIMAFGTESLAGVPSIIFGIFGFGLFVLYLDMGWSVLSGALTLSLMVLPTIVRTAEEALRAVPVTYREGALALGATRFQTVMRVVLPSALPGIGTGIVLAIGRCVGESAALLLTAGAALGIPRHLGDPARAMAVHLYLLASEGISMEKAYGTASVLIFLVIAVNAVANHLARRQGAKVRRSA